MHPTLLHLGPITLPIFGVLAAIGLMLSLTLSLRTALLSGLEPDRLWNAGLFTLLSAFVLSRLLLVATNLHTFFQYPVLLLALPSLTPLGVLLTVLATVIYLHTKKLPLLTTLDAWSPCATLTWAFLAIGHYLEGSDPGMITTIPWAIPSPTGLTRLHPVALYAATCALILTAILLWNLRRKAPTSKSGDTAALALASTGLIQFLLTFLRQPALYGTPFSTFLDPIQWVALAMILAAGVILILRPTASEQVSKPAL